MNSPFSFSTANPAGSWDYLIVTASHADQASAYEAQLLTRRQLGLLTRVRHTMVVADLEGRRIGSGGSTLECLRRVINHQANLGPAAPIDILRRLRILIVHAGGDSRRLPAYSPAGKIFVPVPGPSYSALALTLFDRLIPPFLDLPAPPAGTGQVVVAAGDALLHFDPAAVTFPDGGITMFGTPATPEEASRHGVFCPGEGSRVRLYLQKPTPAEQLAQGAIDPSGRAILDIAVTNFDAAGAARLLQAFEVTPDVKGNLQWSPAMRATLLDRGIDLYREVCCAMGDEATLDHYLRAVRSSGSKWGDAALALVFPALQAIPFHLQTLPECRFLHFGSTRQLYQSGVALLTRDRGEAPESTCLSLNNHVAPAGSITGYDSWVEGCRISAPLTLAGENVVIGADITEPLALPAGAALDVVAGAGCSYLRCYHVTDSFKDARFHARPLTEWLAAVGATEADVFDDGETDRTLWNARVFPALAAPGALADWLWMFDPTYATPAQRLEWLATPRYSAAQIALLANQPDFHARRARIHADRIPAYLPALFAPASPFSARDLAFSLEHSGNPSALSKAVLALASALAAYPFDAARIRHTLGTATHSEPLRTEAATLLATAPQSPTIPWPAGTRFHARLPLTLTLAGRDTTLAAYAAEQPSGTLTVALDLNGHPPIDCYGRVTDQPVIRIRSLHDGTLTELPAAGPNGLDLTVSSDAWPAQLPSAHALLDALFAPADQPRGATLHLRKPAGNRDLRLPATVFDSPVMLLYRTALPAPSPNRLLGAYLDRDRATLGALAAETARVHALATALSTENRAAFAAQLDPAPDAVIRFASGAIIDDGWMLLAARSPRDAARLRMALRKKPLAPHGRSYAVEVNHTGPELTFLA